MTVTLLFPPDVDRELVDDATPVAPCPIVVSFVLVVKLIAVDDEELIEASEPGVGVLLPVPVGVLCEPFPRAIEVLFDASTVNDDVVDSVAAGTSPVVLAAVGDEAIEIKDVLLVSKEG